MKEDFLHFIWKHQYFDKLNLKVKSGENLLVLYQGNHNFDSGPDFQEARLKINEMSWSGHVEIHLRSSDWFRHRHQHDLAYESVILHVVWEDDRPVTLQDTSVIPTLELKGKVDKSWILKYQRLISNERSIPCIKHFSQVREIVITDMLEKVLYERLHTKSDLVLKRLSLANGDWRQVGYATIFESFGFSLNAPAFLRLAELIPFRNLLKISTDQEQLWLLFYGKAGFIEKEAFPGLWEQFIFLCRSIRLDFSTLKASEWKRSRTRPANQPEKRLEQLCALFCGASSFFFRLLHLSSFDQWKSFYENEVEKKHRAGQSSQYRILINAVVPLQVAYGRYHDDQSYYDRAVRLLRSLPAEENRITKLWPQSISEASDSQAVLQLVKHYCMAKQCLHCSIGNSIIKNG